MNIKIAILIPTRGRNKNHLQVLESWRQTTQGNSELVFGIDADDESTYEKQPDAIYEILPKEGKGMGWITNKMATKYAKLYPYIGFQGDDHQFRNEWEQPFLDYLEQTKYGIVYGNDLCQGQNGSGLPSSVVMDSEIVNKLGYMYPPLLKHLMIDVYWKKLGEDKKTIKYFPDVHVEHVHPFVGKAAMDTQYAEINDQSLLQEDNVSLNDYYRTLYSQDLAKLV